MKVNEIVTEAQETSDANKKLASIGRVLMDRAVTTKDDALSNLMAKFGDALTRYGTPFGPRTPQELMKKTGISEEMLRKLLAYGETELKKSGDVAKGANVADEPEDDEDDFDGPSDDEIDARAKRMARG